MTQRLITTGFLAVLTVSMCLSTTAVMAETTAVTWPGPTRLGYPQFVNWGMSRSHVLTFENPGPDTLKITSIVPVEDNYSSESWLSVSPTALTIAPAATDSFTITITATPFFTAGYTYWLNGRAVLHAPDNAAESVDVDIVNYVIADTVVGIVWDTLLTTCTRLIVSSNGDMGKMGFGGYNLDYVGLGTDCSTTPNDDDVYLFSGGPMVIRKTGTDSYVFSSALYQSDQWSTQSFRNVEGTVPSSMGTVDYDRFYTGNMVNRDTSIALSRTYYAPKGGNCHFIIAETKYWARSGPPIPNVMISEVVDWDVPADSGSQNVSGVSLKGFVYQRGITSSSTSCEDSARFAAVALLGYLRKSEELWGGCPNHGFPFDAYAQLTDSIYTYDTATENAEAGYFWNRDTIGTLTALGSSVHRDQHSVLTILRNTTLSATDTLKVYTAMLSVKQGTLADLETDFDAARSFYWLDLRPCWEEPCCKDRVGNADDDPNGVVDVGDLTALIDNLFINFTPLTCYQEGNCDGSIDGIVDVSDLTRLIDNLFITFAPLPYCQ